MDALQPNTTYSYTTLKKLLAEVKLKCRLDHTTAEDIYIIPCILECAKEMCTKLDFCEQTATIPINNLIGVLPSHFMRFDKPNPLEFTTNGKVDISQYYAGFSVTYTGQPFMTMSPFASTNCFWGIPAIQIQKGYIEFSNNITATECTISFEGAIVDDNGEMKIPMLNSRPIIHGAKALYQQSMEKPRSVWDLDWNLWVNGISDRRGEANRPDAFQLEHIERIMNSMF